MYKLLVVIVCLLIEVNVSAKSFFHENIQIAGNNFELIGGFRISSKVYGSSRIAYSTGAFAVSPDDNSYFISGNQKTKGIAEFSVPELTHCKVVADCPISYPRQNFVSIINQLTNDGNLNYVTGLELIEGELFVNALEYYDADASAADTTLIVRTASNLSNSKVDGFFQMSGRNHAAGWMSKLPLELSQRLDASYLTGYASNVPINSRLSQGPSLFVGYLDNFAGIRESKGLIPMKRIMDFDLNSPMVKDNYNKSGQNKTWTIVSNAVYGFILPNSNTYLVVGNSGGHHSKIGYKIEQDNGVRCNGPCAFQAKDYYNYFWQFDVNSIVKGKSNQKPQQHNKIKVIDRNQFFPLIGADYNPVSKRLYLLFAGVDKSQTKWETLPVMAVYQLK